MTESELDSAAREYAQKNRWYFDTDAEYQHCLQDFIAGAQLILKTHISKTQHHQLKNVIHEKYKNSVAKEDVEILLDALDTISTLPTIEADRSRYLAEDAIESYQAKRGESEEIDPTPYCTWCGATSSKNCKCPPRAEND